jgi:hypothetical protein
MLRLFFQDEIVSLNGITIMIATSLALLAASLGVDYSFQPADDGTNRYDYVVQIEPGLLDSLSAENPLPIESYVPQHVRSLRKVRVILGGNGPIERTSFKQLNNGWSTTSNGPPSTFGNLQQGGTAGSGPTVAPPRVLGAVQDAGGSLVDATRTGVQQAGQRLQSAGQHLGSAVDDLSGGTIGRMGDAIRQPFEGTTGSQQNPLQTVGTVGRDLVQDTRQQFDAAGQAVRSGAQQVFGSSSDYRNGDYRNNDYRNSDYRNQGATPSTVSSDPRTIGYGNQNTVSGPNLSDPGGNPFNRTSSNSNVSGPTDLDGGYRNQNAGGQSNRYADQNQNNPSDMVRVPSMNDWQNQANDPNYRNNNSTVSNRSNGYPNNGTIDTGGFGAGPELVTTGRNSSIDGWLSGGTGQPQSTTPTGGDFGAPHGGVIPSAGGNVTTQPGQNPQLGPNGQPLPPESKWGLLIVTGVALFGSVGANFFLGFNYLDARHKYLSAVRRGSRTFGRAEE